MVSTHQQYLCPDFLSPLPATTAVGSAADDSPGASCNASSSSPLLLGQSQDSGKSPLALLAQTCNSIGLPDLPSNTNKSDGASQCTNGGGGGGESRPSPSPCADPFCKTCPPAARACPIGCAQCAGHASQDYASSVWMNPYLASPFFNAGLHPSVAAAAAAAAQVGMFANLANALAGSNHHPTVAQFLNPQNNTTTGQQLQLQQQQQQQSYVCNWMTGDQYCGKRFASGDELLQHLRSHATHDALKTAPSNSSPTIVASSSSSSSSASSASASASALLTRTLCQQQNAAASYLSSLRFHPYTKILSSAAAALPVASPLAPFAYGTPTIPPTIAGLCPSQRLPGTLQQP
ncbi:Zinc finger protein Noc [Trichinella pseudospiralis]|uniref:Zinc finger protein Noc n=1 Tax=Trichinella pseudospiralis TaxID=6337 RepID=A0A0V0XZ10_TRIPS|nr:Zinc finger protein Noc [Trichinella pseudospiralis]